MDSSSREQPCSFEAEQKAGNDETQALDECSISVLINRY